MRGPTRDVDALRPWKGVSLGQSLTQILDGRVRRYVWGWAAGNLRWLWWRCRVG
jgi:hypothetical protein